MGKLLRLGRPQFLIVGLVLFVFGATLALRLGATYSMLRLLLGYLIILPAQLSVSYSNNYFDMAVDSHHGATPFSGGSSILLENPELKKPVKWIAGALVVCSLGMALVFLWVYAYPIWMLGFVALGNLVGWCYSAPPFKLSYRGLGEPAYTLTGGGLIPCMGYLVMKGTLDLVGSFFLIPFLLYGLASILSVEIPDMEVDRLGNKRTWIASKGRSFGFIAVGACLLAATGYFFIFPWLSPWQIPINFHILGLLSLLPLAAGVLGLIKKPIDRKPATKIAIQTIISLVIFSVLADSYLVFLVTH
jgi:1,4-dihydroxy-2-naphthoate octaprenyltransferase